MTKRWNIYKFRVVGAFLGDHSTFYNILSNYNIWIVEEKRLVRGSSEPAKKWTFIIYISLNNMRSWFILYSTWFHKTKNHKISLRENETNRGYHSKLAFQDDFR